MTATSKKTKLADEARLKQLFAEMESLRADGTWNFAEYKRIMGEAHAAAGDQGWMLEQFANFRPDS